MTRVITLFTTMILLLGCATVSQTNTDTIVFPTSRFEPIDSISMNFRVDGKYDRISLTIGMGIENKNNAQSGAAYTHFSSIDLFNHETKQSISVPKHHFSDISCFDPGGLSIQSGYGSTREAQDWWVEFVAYVDKSESGIDCDYRNKLREGKLLPYLYVLTITHAGDIESEYGRID